MNSDMASLSRIDKLVMLLNMLSYRIDALISNMIDGVVIASYIVVFHSLLESQYIPIYVVIPILLSSLIQHYVYFIVYLVNDILDYRSKGGSGKRLNSSFYVSRPVYYFNGSLVIVFYFGVLYLFVLAIIALNTVVPLIVISVFPVLFMATSIIHSILQASYRVLSFVVLRLLRYSLLIQLVIYLLGVELNIGVIQLIYSLMIIPYLVYSMITYAKSIRDRNLVIERSLLLVLLSLSLILLTGLYITGYSITLRHALSICLSWLFVLGPAIMTRGLLRRFFGEDNPSIYQHLARLSIGFILVLLLLFPVLYIVNYVVFIGILRMIG